MSILLKSGELGELIDGIWKPLTALELADRETELEGGELALSMSTSMWSPVLVFENSSTLNGAPSCRIELHNRQFKVDVSLPVGTSVDYIVAEGQILPISLMDMQTLQMIQRLSSVVEGTGLTIGEMVALDRMVSGNQVSVLGRSVFDAQMRSGNPSNFQNLLAVEPYPYQKVGIEWLIAQREQGACGALLADVMGLGKTLQGIGLLAHEVESGRRDNLVICPGTLTENWRRELLRFAPQLSVLLHKGSARAGVARRLKNFDVVISTYDVLLQDWQLLSDVDWNVVVLDEAQAIKNPDAARSRRTKSLPRNFGLAVTGTPLENRVLDLWSVSDFADTEVLPARRTVESARHFNLNDQVSVAESLNNVIRPIMLRRHLEDVDLQLPEKVQIDHALEWPPELISLYEDTRATALADFNRAGGLVAVARLRRLTTHPMMMGIVRPDPRDLSPKFSQLATILEELLERREKAIVFCGYTQMIDYMASWIEDRFDEALVLKLDGRTNMVDRQPMIEELNADSRGAVLVTNPTVAGAGLNITGANHVILYNLEWNPAKEAQAIARIHRIGQGRTCFIHRFYYASTIEEAINERLAEKRELAAIGVDGGLSQSDIRNALEVTPRVTNAN